MPTFVALVPAAGAGLRMGQAVPKQYLPVAGQPLIRHALQALSQCSFLAAIHVLLSPDDAFWDRFDWRDFGQRLRVLRCGGATRAETVNRGLQALRGELEETDWVLVHDAARPCLKPLWVERLARELGEDEVGGLLAIPVSDTLKRADSQGRVLATEPREGLWQAQTPQMFRYGLLSRALALNAASEVTDESRAVEMLGLKPRLVPGDATNLKVTFPQDLALVERLLSEGKTP
ncbi:2-C-methyl-D-erythritol 4-phosphate cytidylyltransferase [Pelomicrobium sp.]|jgi:2-C-methyl-D-erythritol 4-phosphate cytidylyltransferase|uniref:2-C-methyl-D-erythritol 4-phosphate cytidylyltransferase n=1 Tax=Pelomicrobium sp. TaxID=2815319 RepID=UPI002FDE220F